MTKPQEEILKGFYKLLSTEFNRLTTVVENTTPEQDEFAGKAATLLEAADIHFPYLKHIQDYAQEVKPAPEPFKKFWVVSVNNYLCDASYSGKALKERHFAPSFRKFYFIRSWDELKGFTKRKEISNEDLVKKALGIAVAPTNSNS